jgi:hypothetical protein
VTTFHVTSTLNRASITRHGLDCERMGLAPGIAGSKSPEVPGVFVCLDEGDVDWFAFTINNTGGPVDVWAVEGIDPASLLDNGNGYGYLPEKIPPSRLTLIRTDLPAPEDD